MGSNRLIRLLLIAGLAAGAALALVYRDRFDGAALESWVQSAGIAAPLLFMLIYALAAVLFLPGSVLTLAGGALFGPVLGTFYNLTGGTLGAMLAFLIARYLFSDFVARKAGGRVPMRELRNGSRPLETAFTSRSISGIARAAAGAPLPGRASTERSRDAASARKTMACPVE